MADEDFVAILYCSVCTSPVDIEETGEVEFICDTCETKHVITVERQKIEMHSHN